MAHFSVGLLSLSQSRAHNSHNLAGLSLLLIAIRALNYSLLYKTCLNSGGDPTGDDRENAILNAE
jgi:hypothetical protein